MRMKKKGGNHPAVGILLGAAGALALRRVWRRHRFDILRLLRRPLSGRGRGTERRSGATAG